MSPMQQQYESTLPKRKREMFCWSVASLGLLDRTTLIDSVNILTENKKLPRNLTIDSAFGTEKYGVEYSWYGRGILEHILIPFLHKESSQR